MKIKSREISIKQIIPLLVAILFVMAGFGLSLLYGSSRYNQNVTNGEPGYTGVSLGDEGFSQRVLGNDYPLKEAIFRVFDMDVNPETLLVVDFYLRADNETEGTLLSRQEFTVEQLRERNAVVMKIPTVKLVYNRDYYFKFYYKNHTSGDLSLVVANTGDDPYYPTLYGPDGKQLQGAVYYQFVMGHGKDYKLFPWSIVVVFFGIPLLVTLVTARSFWKSLLYTVIGISLLLIGMGALALLPYVSVVLMAVGVASVLLSGYLLSFSKPARENMPSSNWLQMLVFAVSLVILYLQTYRLPVHYQDEYNHWTLAVENLYLFGKMHIHPESTVRLFRYPPLTSLFEYLILCFYGKYSEGIICFALKIFQLPAIFALLDYKKAGKKSCIFYIFAGVMALILPELWIDREFTNTICTDIAAGLYTALLMVEGYRYLRRPDQSKARMIVVLTFLQILIKDNCMILLGSVYGALLCSMLIYRMVNKRSLQGAWSVLGYSILGFVAGRGLWTFWSQLLASGMKDTTFRYILLGVIVVVATLLILWKAVIAPKLRSRMAGWTPDKARRMKRVFIWGIGLVGIAILAVLVVVLLGKGYLNTSNEDLSAVAISGLSVQSVVRYLSGNGLPYQYEIIPLHIHKLFFQPVYETGVFNMSYFGAVLCILLVLGLAYQMREGGSKSQFVTVFLFLLCSAVLCAAAYHVVYTFTLEDFEAVTFAAEERYLGSMLLAMTGLLLYLIGRWSETFTLPQLNMWLAGILAGVLIMTSGGIEMLWGINTPERYESFDSAVAANLRKVVRETDRIYYAPTEATAYDMPQYRYVAAPVVVDSGLASYDAEATPDLYAWYAIGYDYIYVQEVDDSFRTNYQRLIPEGMKLEDYSIYHIESNEAGDVQMVHVQTLAQ